MKMKFIMMIFALILFQWTTGGCSENKNDFSKIPIGQIQQAGLVELEILMNIERRGAPNSWFGSSVAGIGDVNMDGFDDVLMGNYYKNAGEVYLLYGGSPMDSIPDMIFYGEYNLDQFGFRVSSAGDVNGDSFPDFIISAPNYPEGRAKVEFISILEDLF